MAHPVLVPLINPNEPEALLTSLKVQEGQQVEVGQTLATFETTKATADLTAETAGYIAGLRCQEGDSLKAGEVFCYMSESQDWKPDTSLRPEPESAGKTAPGLRITQPALALVKARGLSIDRLPIGPLVTETMVQEMLKQEAQTGDFSLIGSAFDPTAILIYGAGGHGKSVADLLRTLGAYQIAGFLDDGAQAGTQVMGIPVLGGKQVLTEVYARGVRLAVNAVGGIGNVSVRVSIFRRLAEAGFVCPAIVHPSAVVEASATLEAGVQVFPHAYVGSEAHIGYGTIVNTGAIVSHDCRLDQYVNISPGAMLAGEVRIGAGTLVGMGVTINLGVTIGSGARIGNGATVKSDLPGGGVVRAGTIWPAPDKK